MIKIVTISNNEVTMAPKLQHFTHLPNFEHNYKFSLQIHNNQSVAPIF